MKTHEKKSFRYRGLEQTQCWRWLIYGLLFTGVVAFFGLKFDKSLLVAAPVGAVFIVAVFFGMDRLFKNPSGQSWLLRNLMWLILIFIVGKIALFAWDIVCINTRKPSSQASQSIGATAPLPGR